MNNENKQIIPASDDNSMLVFGSQGNFENAQRMAIALSKSTLVPQIYQQAKDPNAVSNCIIALEMANRIRMSPLMVMQNLYVVYGNVGWSSKFLIAATNASGRFSPLRYETKSEQGKDDWGCRAWAMDSTGEKLYGPWVDIAMAKKEGWYTKNGSKWQSIPELMLRYRAATFFSRTYAPEIGMGMQTSEELYDTRPINVEATVIPNEINPSEIQSEQEAKEALLKGQINKQAYNDFLAKALRNISEEPDTQEEPASHAQELINNNAFGLKDIAKEHGTE